MNNIQEIINKDIDTLIDISYFKSKNVQTLVKNTHGVKCNKCGSTNINCRQVQTRSGDEGATNFYTCLDCNQVWRTNN